MECFSHHLVKLWVPSAFYDNCHQGAAGWKFWKDVLMGDRLSWDWAKGATHVLRLSLCLHDKKMEDKFGKQPMPIEMQIYNQSRWQLGKQLIPFLIKYNSNSKEKVNRPREATWDMWRVWL